MPRFGWLVAVPAFMFALLAPDRAYSEPFTCREVDKDETLGPIYECRATWLPNGSRITAEQRITVNAVIAVTMILPTRRRQ